MLNPLKSIGRWWLARELPDDLKAGDVCMIQSGDGSLGVVKVLAVDSWAVHVRLYEEKFSEAPRLVNIAALSISLGHLPISRAVFASWEPVRIQYETVAEVELEGYRIWQEAGGGVWD